MQRYKVKITGRASSDIDKIHDYIKMSLCSPLAAKKQYDYIYRKIKSLTTFPERCPLFPQEPEHSRGLRRLIVGNYIVCFLIDETTVLVTNVYYGAADIHSRLSSR